MIEYFLVFQSNHPDFAHGKLIIKIDQTAQILYHSEEVNCMKLIPVSYVWCEVLFQLPTVMLFYLRINQSMI